MIKLRHDAVAVRPIEAEEIHADGGPGHAVRAEQIASGLYLLTDHQIHGRGGTLLYDVHSTQGVVDQVGPDCRQLRVGDRVVYPDASIDLPVGEFEGALIFRESQILCALHEQAAPEH
jgi:hypothetical protein